AGRPRSRCPGRGTCRSGGGRDPGWGRVRSSGQFFQHGVENGPAILGVDPTDARVTAEPALLTAGEPAGALPGERQRVVERAAPGEVVEQLLVAEGLAGRARQRAGAQAADLVEQAGVELGVVAGVDALV